MGQFERRLSRWWSNSSVRRAWRRRADRDAAGSTGRTRELRDLRRSETARKAEAALRELRDSETARKAQDAVRDLRDTETARKAQATVRDLRATDTGRKAEATIQEAEAAARAAYLRVRRSMRDR